MKKLLSVVFIMISFQLFGQAINKKWVQVVQLRDQNVYVDTSAIKEVEGQISTLCITYFNPPKMINALGTEAASVKSQILFNLASQKYTTVGTLYYDSKLKLLGESSVPGLSVSGESFSTPIDSSQAMVAVYAYCLNYINRGERVIENVDFSRSSNKVKSFSDNKVKIDTSKKNIEEPSLSTKADLPVPAKSIPETKSSTVKKNIQEPVRKDSSVKIVNQVNKKNDALNTLALKKKSKDTGIEVLPKSSIFKEGDKYSFQISSWKNKATAVSEVARLKAKGHNAFYVEAYIPERGGTWYRVRIGNFNSVEETQAYMKKLK